MSRKDICFNWEIRNFVRVGSPIAFQEIMTQLSFLALCAFINRLGLDASSGYGVANKIVSFILLIPASLMQSMSSFVSQNVGARKEDRAIKAMLTGMGLGAGIGVFVALAAFVKGDLMAAVFTSALTSSAPSRTALARPTYAGSRRLKVNSANPSGFGFQIG